MGRVNRKVQLIILLVLVCLVGTMSIAYAILSTTLNINGTAQVQYASWNVHFDNVEVNPYSVEINPVITDNNKVSFSADLTTPGDFYKFTVDIVNEGSIDAMIESIIKTPELTDEEKKYLRYEVEYVDGTSINDAQLLKSGETKTISVLFSYRNDIPTSDLPTTESEFNLEIVLVYVQADTTGVEISGTNSVINVVSGDINTVGSEICIRSECFYVISSDNDGVTMLAKYNLHVGKSVDGENKEFDEWVVTHLENPTGKQDSMAGWHVDSNGNDIFPIIGVTEFSTTNYWNSDVSDYPSYVYNNNSTLYGYVENYKTYLEDLGVSPIESRLITYEELVSLGCDDLCLTAPPWVYSSTYWTGTAEWTESIMGVDVTGGYGSAGFDSPTSGMGVRPVIKISKDYF